MVNGDEFPMVVMNSQLKNERESWLVKAAILRLKVLFSAPFQAATTDELVEH